MPQVNKIRILIVLLAAGLSLLLVACGSSKPNPKAPFNPESQKHAADWLPHRHMEAAQANLASCKECHGSDLLGGISRVSCTKCHLGGEVDSVHPTDWDEVQIWSKHKNYVAGIGTSECSNVVCHGAGLEGVEHAPACASCHLDGVSSKHLQAWGANAAFLHGDFTLANGGAKCANAACHGSSLGGVSGSGPACATCHSAPHPGDIAQRPACSSCHPANGISTSELFHNWAAPTSLNHAAYVTTSGNASCAIASCHGTALTGGINASCPSCTSCHLGGVASVHPVEWGAAIIQVHQTFVAANSTAACANAACHGPNLTGGTASAPSCATCHVGGVITISKHPFAAPVVANHKSYVVLNGNASCALAACHGPGLTGAGNAPSCVTACHLGDATTKHPASFGTTTIEVDLNHKAFIALNAVSGKDGMDGCRNSYCHGSSLTGAAPALGGTCSTTACHQSGSPATLTNCASCHGKPPTAAAAPNREGAHAEHNALTGVTNECGACHTGAGTGTANHFNNAVNVQLVSTFSSSFGTAAPVRNADGTCSNVSCHGGQTTPVWLTGTINVDTQCTLCHASGAAQYNSYSSGRHSLSNHTAFACTACHSASILAQNHFTSLNTSTTLNGLVAQTIVSAAITTYNSSGNKSCSAICHGTNPKNWLP